MLSVAGLEVRTDGGSGAPLSQCPLSLVQPSNVAGSGCCRLQSAEVCGLDQFRFLRKSVLDHLLVDAGTPEKAGVTSSRIRPGDVQVADQPIALRHG